MGKLFSLQIITPSHDVYNGNIEKIFLKSIDGEFQILANHENMVASTIPCIARFVDDNQDEQKLFLSSSIVQVEKDKVIICTDAAEFPEDIDFERAEKAKKRAEEKLENLEGYEKELYSLALARAIERLKLR